MFKVFDKVYLTSLLHDLRFYGSLGQVFGHILSFHGNRWLGMVFYGKSLGNMQLILVFVKTQNLSFCEARRSELRSIRKFANVCWVINDLTAIIDGGRIERSCNEINFHQLELKKENTSYSEEFLLDLGINLEQKKNKTQLYYKRINFPFFSSQNASHLTNNVSSKMLIYIGAEILQTA